MLILLVKFFLLCLPAPLQAQGQSGMLYVTNSDEAGPGTLESVSPFCTSGGLKCLQELSLTLTSKQLLSEKSHLL